MGLALYPASYVLIERLIENNILFDARKDINNLSARMAPVDPKRLYLIGFSAGGDAVYRLATRLAQRFGAVNMGGDHPDATIQEGLDNIRDDNPKRLESVLRNLANTRT